MMPKGQSAIHGASTGAASASVRRSTRFFGMSSFGHDAPGKVRYGKSRPVEDAAGRGAYIMRSMPIPVNDSQEGQMPKADLMQWFGHPARKDFIAPDHPVACNSRLDVWCMAP